MAVQFLPLKNDWPAGPWRVLPKQLPEARNHNSFLFSFGNSDALLGKQSSLMKTHKNIFVFRSFSPLSPIQWVEGPTLKMSYGLPWCGTLRPKPLRTGEWRFTCCPRKQDTLSSGAASFGKSAGSTWGREITCNTSIISKNDQINTSEKIKYAFVSGYNYSTGETWFKTLCAVLSHRKGFFCI